MRHPLILLPNHPKNLIFVSHPIFNQIMPQNKDRLHRTYCIYDTMFIKLQNTFILIGRWIWIAVIKWEVFGRSQQAFDNICTFLTRKDLPQSIWKCVQKKEGKYLASVREMHDSIVMATIKQGTMSIKHVHWRLQSCLNYNASHYIKIAERADQNKSTWVNARKRDVPSFFVSFAYLIWI